MLEINKSNTVLVFPGQGSQKVGMCQSFQETEIGKKLLQTAEEVLGRDISKLMFEGPQENLTKTNNAQLALYVTGFIACELLKENQGQELEDITKFLAGHSLGEYTALAQAGVFSFEDGLRLVDSRAKAMLAATENNPGSMAAVLGLSIQDVKKLADETNTFIANDNTVGQIVISGAKEYILNAIDKAKEFGAKRAIELPVSGAFHSPLMQDAADEMAKIIDGLDMQDAKIPVVTNVTGKAHTNVSEIKENMKTQITGSVKWVDSMSFMKEDGIENIIELGIGNVLCGLFKKFDKEINSQSISTMQDLKGE